MTADSPVQATYATFTESFKSCYLATSDVSGFPNASYAPFAMAEDKSIFINISELSRHTQNLMANPRASVLFIEEESTAKFIFGRKRLTYQCEAEILYRGFPAWDEGMALMEKKFGESMSGMKSMADFHLFRLKPREGIMVLGFGAAYAIGGEGLSEIRHQNGKGHGHSEKTAAHGGVK